MDSTIDVLGLGCTAVDEILYVDEFPHADLKTRVLARERCCGGLTATALVAAARLGARCAYAGTLGDDEDSRFVLETLEREGIDVRFVRRKPGFSPVRSVIVVDEKRQTRNIFFDESGAGGADPRHPPKELIQSSRVLLVDRFGMAGMIRAARIARASGVPVVGDFENRDSPWFGELLSLVDHLIVGERFAMEFTGAAAPAAAAVDLWSDDRRSVVVTCGAKGCWVLAAARHRPTHIPAFRVAACDTTGCGDVFHGAYAAGLAKGLNLHERIELASAAAALKAARRGGQPGIPLLSELKTCLTEKTGSRSQRKKRRKVLHEFCG